MKGIKINWGVFADIEEDLNEQVEVIGNTYENKELIEVECN